MSLNILKKYCYMVLLCGIQNFSFGMDECLSSRSFDSISSESSSSSSSSPMTKIDQKLFEAVRRGSRPNIRSALANGARLDAVSDLKQFTPLHEAVLNGSLSGVRTLVEAGANINIVDVMGRSPLQIAVSKGFLKITQFLLAREGIKVNARDTNGYTAMHFVANGSGSRHIIRALIGAGADLNAIDFAGRTPLHIATISNKSKTVKHLLSYDNIEIDKPDSNGKVPLHFAIAGTGNPKIINYFVKAGADLNATDNLVHQTPLYMTVVWNNLKAMRILLASGRADINATDNKGYTPLHKAILMNRTPFIQILIATGASIYTNQLTYSSPMEAAISQKDKAVVEILTKMGY